jgi:hypothetical protein
MENEKSEIIKLLKEKHNIKRIELFQDYPDFYKILWVFYFSEKKQQTMFYHTIVDDKMMDEKGETAIKIADCLYDSVLQEEKKLLSQNNPVNPV